MTAADDHPSPHPSHPQRARGFSLVRLIIAIILGVLTTYAVAWACCSIDVYSGGKATYQIGLSHRTKPTWQVYQYDRFGSTIVQSRMYDGSIADLPAEQFLDHPVPSWSIANSPPEEVLPSSTEIASAETIENARGWPMRAVRCTGVWGGFATRWRISLTGALELPDSIPVASTLIAPVMNAHMLPYAPIWPGMIINTVLYCIVWVVILFVPRAVIRLRRLVHGQCRECGYDLRGSTSEDAPCPECGNAK
ncbi:MAG: hypothetical protein D8M59_04175 [Planctomycetes bacterium]|nr:hypothetical protein [Planctomycetota bacterium]